MTGRQITTTACLAPLPVTTISTRAGTALEAFYGIVTPNTRETRPIFARQPRLTRLPISNVSTRTSPTLRTLGRVPAFDTVETRRRVAVAPVTDLGFTAWKN